MSVFRFSNELTPASQFVQLGERIKGNKNEKQECRDLKKFILYLCCFDILYV